jgi:hypothetical protein
MSAALHVLLLFHMPAKEDVYSSNSNLQLLYTVAREHGLLVWGNLTLEPQARRPHLPFWTRSDALVRHRLPRPQTFHMQQ